MRRGTRTACGGAVAFLVHGVVAAALAAVDPDAFLRKPPELVELELNEPPPPPPEVKPPEPTPEPTPEPRPRIVPRKLAAAPPPPEAKPAAPEPPTPPPPNQETRPEPVPNAPPVFGVTMNSVVSGGAGIAVPVGNTLMTKDRTRAKPQQPAQPYAAEGTRPFVPVADIYIKDRPRVIKEVKGQELYPPEARRLGIEGRVKLLVSIDEKGDVVAVKVIEPAGHGFDEAAVKALKQFKFSPARTADGRAVPDRIPYVYGFEPK